MRQAVGAFLVAAAVVVAGWGWLGQTRPMPMAPLGPQGKLDCISYAPFRGDETPIDLSTKIPPTRIEEDLLRLAEVTNCVRTYSVHQGLDQVTPIAQRIGLKVMQGLWLGRDPAFNREQIDGAVAIARRYPNTVRAVVVGNEVLLRGELSAAALAEIVRSVKSQVSVPVTYADVWEFWLRNRDLVAAVDFVSIHILPYWEDFPISADKAADHVIDIRRQVAQSFPGKDIMIAEFGWPSAGRMREGALPSPSNQAQVIQEVIARAAKEQFALNVIEAFDQPWKRRFEGTVGGHWGLLDGDTRVPKFGWGKPVSDHPDWQRNVALGVILAGAVVGAAFLLRREHGGGNVSNWMWAGVAAIAAIAGLLLGLTVEHAIVESLGWGGIARSVALLAIATLGPIIAAVALARGVHVPPFEQVLGRATERSMDRVTFLLGLFGAALAVVAIQVALGLVFDPRYRDFPYAPLSAAVVPMALVGLQGFGMGGTRRAPEITAAIILLVSTVYIVFNESFVNWQAVWLCVVFVTHAGVLAQRKAVQG